MELMDDEKLKETRYGVPSELHREWKKLLKRTGIPQVQVLNRLVRFILLQDEITQGMVLGSLSLSPELLSIALRRASKSPADVSSTTSEPTFVVSVGSPSSLPPKLDPALPALPADKPKSPARKTSR